MQYRNLGHTGLKVSEIGLGGEWLERCSEAEAAAVIDRCAEQGINILDCWMSEPNVRSSIGKAIASNRGDWIVQGHFGSAWIEGQFEKTREISAVQTAFEDLLRRMGTDYIDLGMIFYVDDDADYLEVTQGPFLDYVREQKEKGKIRHIGMSTHNPAIAERAIRDGIVETIMFPVNPAFDLLPAMDELDSYFTPDGFDEAVYAGELAGVAPERANLYELCAEKGIGLTVMKGYGGGRLLDAAASPFGVALTPVQCLHYALSTPAVSSVMVGCGSPEEVDAACAYETADEEEKAYAAVLAEAPRHGGTAQCTYCGHCAPCPAHIDIAMVNKLYDLGSLAEGGVPDSVGSHYEDLDAHAGDCLQCRACEKRCPFHVQIAERMRKAKELFGK